MRKHQLPEIEYLRQRLRYEPETGKIFWRWHESQRPQWNARHAGKEAFLTLRDNGYLVGFFNSSPIRAHRVAYAIHHGVWPNGDVDHINGIRSDNRISNLRAVNRSENMRNSKRYKCNKTGITGVYWHKPSKKYQAKIQVDKKQIHLGLFATKDAAIKARIIAEKEYGFHPNHGRAS